MSGTVPPIPPPIGTNSGNIGIPNHNNFDTMPINIDTINATTTTNVAQNAIDENLPQLLDSRRDRPFIPLSTLSTLENLLPKRPNQWSNAESRLANQDKRLKSIIISCLPNDVMKFVIKYKTTKEMWNDLILAHDVSFDIRDTKIVALRLKFNAFKSLEGEKVNGTFTRLKCLLNDLENNGVIIPQVELNATVVKLSMNQTQRANNSIKNDSLATLANNSIKNDSLATLFGKYDCEEGDSDVEEDQRISSEFMADLNVEYHERALLENHKSHFQKDCPSNKTSTPSYPSPNNSFNKPKPYTPSFTQTPSQNTGNHQKDYKGKCKGLKAEIAVLTQRINDLSREDEGTTKFKAFIAIAKDEPSIRKADTRSDEISNLKKVIEKWICSKVTLDQLSEQVPGNIVKALGGRGMRKENSSSKEVIFTKADESSSEPAPEIASNSEFECETHEPLPPLPKLTEAKPSSTSNSLISLSDITTNMAELTLNSTTSKRSKQTSDKVLRNHPTNDFYSKPKCSICGSNDHLTKHYIEQAAVKKTLIKLKAQSPLYPTPKKTPRIPKPFRLPKEESSLKEVFGDKSLGDIEGYGSVNCNGITFTRVAYVNGLKHNLINISQLCDANFKVLFTKTQRTIFNQNDKVVLIAPRRRDVYVIDMSSYNEGSNTCFFAKASPSVNWLWHKRLSYLNFKNINNLAKHNLVSRLPSLTFLKDKNYLTCEKRKHRRATFKTKRKMENLNENFSSPCTLEQNGVAERRNRTLIEEARTMLNCASLPIQFWREAVNTACYTQNRSIIVKRHGKIAYEVFRGRAPDISYFHVFGCPVHIHNHKDHLGKFNEKANDGFFLCYSPMAKAFKTSTEGDTVNFDEVSFFPDDEFLEPKCTDTQYSANTKYFPYVPAFDRLSIINSTILENITSSDSTIPHDSKSLEEP
ncbi:retrovirus-related pol polyprotein from transposon TNT 1-94 [Tanacetum coccineum]